MLSTAYSTAIGAGAQLFSEIFFSVKLSEELSDLIKHEKEFCEIVTGSWEIV